MKKRTLLRLPFFGVFIHPIMSAGCILFSVINRVFLVWPNLLGARPFLKAAIDSFEIMGQGCFQRGVPELAAGAKNELTTCWLNIKIIHLYLT
jgi:hypothetical protein